MNTSDREGVVGVRMTKTFQSQETEREMARQGRRDLVNVGVQCTKSLRLFLKAEHNGASFDFSALAPCRASFGGLPASS